MSFLATREQRLATARLKILVYHVGFIGDTVVSIPALRALRRHYGPDAEICVLHEEHERIAVSPRDVLAGLGMVDRFLAYPFRTSRVGALLSAAVLWSRLVRERFDAVIYLAPSERPPASVRRDALFFRLCGIGVRLGFWTPRELKEWADHDIGSPRDRGVRPEVLRKLDRIAMSGIDVSAELEPPRQAISLPIDAIESAQRWLEANRRHPERHLVAFCPGAKNPANWWSPDRFVDIGRRLLALEQFELVVIGGPSDRNVAERMLREWDDGLNAAGALTVLGSAALLAQCRFMVGLDTGMTHLAGALRVGGVAIYGGRDPVGLWDPYGGVHTVVRHPVPCAGCRLTTCPVEGHPCMSGITVENVWAAMQSHIPGPDAAAPATGEQERA